MHGLSLQRPGKVTTQEHETLEGGSDVFTFYVTVSTQVSISIVGLVRRIAEVEGRGRGSCGWP